jgi:hypothetical protein
MMETLERRSPEEYISADRASNVLQMFGQPMVWVHSEVSARGLWPGELFLSYYLRASAPILNHFLNHCGDRFFYHQVLSRCHANHGIGSFLDKLNQIGIDHNGLPVKTRELNHHKTFSRKGAALSPDCPRIQD